MLASALSAARVCRAVELSIASRVTCVRSFAAGQPTHHPGHSSKSTIDICVPTQPWKLQSLPACGSRACGDTRPARTPPPGADTARSRWDASVIASTSDPSDVAGDLYTNTQDNDTLRTAASGTSCRQDELLLVQAQDQVSGRHCPRIQGADQQARDGRLEHCRGAEKSALAAPCICSGH